MDHDLLTQLRVAVRRGDDRMNDHARRGDMDAPMVAAHRDDRANHVAMAPPAKMDHHDGAVTAPDEVMVAHDMMAARRRGRRR